MFFGNPLEIQDLVLIKITAENNCLQEGISSNNDHKDIK